MNTSFKPFGFKQGILAASVLVALGHAQAQEDAAAMLIKPDIREIGIGYAGVPGNQADRSIFGQYNGWGSTDAGLLLDFQLVKRDEATGTWLHAEGLHLGQDNREFSISRQKQGDWKYSLEYSEQVRHDPRTINTGLQGIGTIRLTVNALPTTGTGINQNLDIKRQSYTLSTEKWVNPNLLVEASLKSEKKDGIRMAGIGAYCSNFIGTERCASTSGALLLLPEPINSITNQLEIKANFVGKDYSLTAGYYGTSFTDNVGSSSATINGNLYTLNNTPFTPGAGINTLGSLLTQPIASAPNNQSYQIYLSGSYAWNPTIRANFNVSVTHATQNQSFASMGITPVAGLPSSLDGVVDTTQAQFGITARPLPKLTLIANTRYEEVADKTPLALYGGTYSNSTNSFKKANSKAEASYLFPESIRGTFGMDYNWEQRNIPAVGSTLQTISPSSLTSVREFTNEMIYRVELRKSMSETANASIAYARSKRDGSHWINLGATSANYPLAYQTMRFVDIYTIDGVFPTSMMDRSREKMRAMVDWAASDKLTIQLALENNRDTYTAPTTKGLHAADISTIGLDATYAVSANWKTTGYINFGTQRVNIDHSAGYLANIDNTNSSVGFSVTGKLGAKLEIGGDMSYMDDSTHYGLASANATPAGVLPDVNYRMLALKLFGKYALDSSSDIRIDLAHQNVMFDEWTWGSAGVPFAYSDNSTVSMLASQIVNYLGVRYVYRFK